MSPRFFARIAIVLGVMPLTLVACASPRAVNEPPPSASSTTAPQSPDDFIYSLLAKGKSYSNQRDYAKALVAFKKAYSSLQPDTSPSIKGIVLNHLGGALIETGNYTEAIPVCHSALLVNISCNNRIETTVSHMNLGDAVWKSGKITVAKQHWEMAYQMASQMGHFGLLNTAQSRLIATH